MCAHFMVENVFIKIIVLNCDKCNNNSGEGHSVFHAAPLVTRGSTFYGDNE